MVNPESNKTLRSLVEYMVPMVLHVAKEQDRRFIFLWLVLVY